MSLVRLRQQQALKQEAEGREQASHSTQRETRDRFNQAHTMLSKLYDWFTGGFDTKDLQDAKALLEELSH